MVRLRTLLAWKSGACVCPKDMPSPEQKERRVNSRERVVLLPVLTHTLDSGTLALLWQKFSQGYAELNHLRQCGQREGRARVM